MNWRAREAAIRASIDEELVVFDQHICKPIAYRDSRALASVSTRSVAVAEQATITMQTEVEAT